MSREVTVSFDSKAYNIVKEAFKDKLDKGGNPYMNHLRKVAILCPDYTLEKGYTTVALLHDLLEDCEDWSEDRLRNEFSKDVCDAVVCLTKVKHEKYSDYIERVKSNPIAIIVKIADLKDNMDITRLKEIRDKDIERLKKYHRTWIELNEFINN